METNASGILVFPDGERVYFEIVRGHAVLVKQDYACCILDENETELFIATLTEQKKGE